MSALSTEDITVTDPTFASLGVPAPLVAVLAKQGITVPFPIQAATLPDALAGRDILGRAQTGSGKTLGFSLPLVARLADGHTMACRPRGLILVPTRELATQVHAVLTPLAQATGLKVATIFGGTSQNPQVTALRNRADIVVACPGRLADLIEQGHCHLGDVEITVIDEADHMADLGFLPVVRRLLDIDPGRRPADAVLRHPRRRGRRARPPVPAPPGEALGRRRLHAAGDRPPPAHRRPGRPGRRHRRAGRRREPGAGLHQDQARRRASSPASSAPAGTPAAELHGNLTAGRPHQEPGGVRQRRAPDALVATDIAARGIHVDGIDLVIHADPPTEHKAYMHRSGRTARGGAEGIVVTVQTAAAGGRGPHADAQGGRQPARVRGRPGLGGAAGDRRPPAKRVHRPAAPARPVTLANQPGSRGAAAASSSFRGRRGRR